MYSYRQRYASSQWSKFVADSRGAATVMTRIVVDKSTYHAKPHSICLIRYCGRRGRRRGGENRYQRPRALMTSGFLRSVKSKMADCTGKTKVKTSATTADGRRFFSQTISTCICYWIGFFYRNDSTLVNVSFLDLGPGSS